MIQRVSKSGDYALLLAPNSTGARASELTGLCLRECQTRKAIHDMIRRASLHASKAPDCLTPFGARLGACRPSHTKPNQRKTNLQQLWDLTQM